MSVCIHTCFRKPFKFSKNMQKLKDALQALVEKSGNTSCKARDSDHHVKDSKDRGHERSTENYGSGRAILNHRHRNLTPAVACNNSLEKQKVSLHDR